VPTLAVDGSNGIAATVAAVERRLREALEAGPRAEALGERQALLREINDAIAAQVRGYCARPWAQDDADAVVREFVCGCGGTACTADVAFTVGALAGGPALAPGHR
jgi:hypothetical protein